MIDIADTVVVATSKQSHCLPVVNQILIGMHQI